MTRLKTLHLTLPLLLTLAACTAAPRPVVAQEIRGDDPRVIQIDATATVRRAPDRGVVQLAVETVAATAQEASRENARVMERVLAAVRALGIPAASIQTGRINLFPRYDDARPIRDPRDPREPARARTGEPEIIGYTARNMVVVTVDSLPLVGPVIDTGVEAGANRVSGVHFELRDPEAAHREAIRMAVERARRQAGAVAEALGETLGPALRVSTSGFHAPFRATHDMVQTRAAAPPPAPPTPVQPGEVDVQAHVSITFRIGT